MGTDISGIAKNILQVRANLKAESPDKDAGQAISVSFMELMNQNSLPNMNASVSSKQISLQADVKGSASSAYDPYLSSAKSLSVKQEMTPEEMRSEMGDMLETYEEEIRNVLKEELGVTDEEISDAMESLGMSFWDVRNAQDLTALVQQLTGEDIGTLFLSESFQSVMEQVTALTEELCAELGITKEALDVLCESWKQTNLLDGSGKVEAESLGDAQILPQKGEWTAAEESSDVIMAEEASDTVVVKKEDTAVKEDIAKGLEDSAETLEKTVSEAEKETGAGTDGKGFSDQFTESGANTSHIGAAVDFPQAVNAEEFILPQEVQQPYANQVDAFDLIDQIAKNVRVTITASETSMEMQLNPENLGKIYLNVTEREGVVRAQITAQNTVVKEALETQLVELRQNLNQQGVKVDAIEVTVGTHEFEQNLEENARQEEQMRKQMEESRKQARRNLNLDDLDELSGLMSEEERLAAQIMRDNGNQVDLTA